MSVRVFVLYTWDCLRKLAREEQSREHIDEYEKAWNFLKKTATKLYYTKSLRWFLYSYTDWGDAYERLWKIGIRLLEIYAEEGRLAAFSEGSYGYGETIEQFIEYCQNP